MKKLLLILVCVFFSLGSLWAQAGSATINAYAVCDYGDGVYTQEGGIVQASAVQCEYKVGYFKQNKVTGDESTSSSAVGRGGYQKGIFNTYKEGYYVQATRKSTGQNYYFTGWYSGTAQAPSISSGVLEKNDTYKKDYAYNVSGTDYVYAVFKKIINPRQSSISWTKTTETATLPTEVILYKAANFQVASITCNGNPNTSSFTCTPSNTTTSEGKITLTLTAGADVKDGDKFVITLTSDNNGYATITVDILTEIKVKFAPPAKGKGSYKAVRTNGDGVTTCTLDQNSSAETPTFNEILNFYHTLTATPADGYRFYRWVIEDASGKTYSMTNPFGYTVKNGDRISVEFLPEGVAQFIVKGEDGVYYYELDAAIAAAQKSTSKTVVVSESGLLSLENQTANSDGKYEFTIPAGITLLVPGDAAYTVQNNGVTNSEDAGGTSTATLFRQLILQDNTAIIVNGNICVYSKLSSKQTFNGMPYNYGEIKMGNNCQIEMKNGSVLTVFGYISGDPETSKVVVESGSKVYEVFQFTDWRGGSAVTGGMSEIIKGMASGKFGAIKNDYKIFPMSQYYLQNIETKLILHYGAKEYVSSVIDVEGVVPVNMLLISEATTNEDAGFLCLGENAIVTKWYDKENDRQKYILEGRQGVTGVNAKISYMFLALNIMNLYNVNLDSRDYVLPINSNIDISVKNLKITSPYDICFLAGSTFTIYKDAEFQSNARLYVYDKEPIYVDASTSYNGFSYPNNVLINPIKYTAAHKKVPGIRTPDKTLDACFNVNGKLTINSALYTTTHGSNITDAIIQRQNYGANITSDGGGEVVFNNVGSETITYQYTQSGTTLSVLNIPITTGRLRNADKSWSAGANAEAGQRYIYYNDIDGGKWCLPTNAFTTSNIPTLAVTLPTATDTQFAEFKLRSTSMQESDFTVTLDNASFKAGELTIEGDKLKVPITYTAQNKQGSATANITLTYTPESFSLKEAITATEDYTPDFSVASTELAFDPIYVDGSAEKALAITPGKNNVTTLLDNENMVWTSSISGTNSSEFEFTYGEGKNKLSGAKVKFDPGSAGTNKSATLTLTATYTDANGAEKLKSVNVSLTATANLNSNNLDFAKFPEEIIAGVTGKFPLFEAGTNNAGTTITTELTEDGVIEIIKENGVDYVNVLSAGFVTINVTQEASITIAGTEISKTITVKSKDAVLSRVPLCIDTKDKFNIHTVSANAVSYSNNKTIDFASTETTSSEWVFQFLGIPDKLVFTPTGGNTWNVEERASAEEGWSPVVNWTTFTSGEQVAISLKPTTRQLRIQYGAGETGSISGLCVSAFTIKSDVDKVYLPVNGTSKEVKFIHTATPLTISEVDGVTATISSTENKGTNEEPYYETTVELTATEADKNVTLTASVTDANSSVHTKAIAIRTYAFPQELPIKLGEDALERYHFVTTASEYAQWDATNRKIVFQNPGAYLTRYVTFAFNGAPGEIRFTTSADINSSDWVIKESVNGVTFTEAAIDKRTVEGTSFKQELNYTTRYLSVEYKSENLSEVALSGLVIEGFPMAWATPEQLSLSEEQRTASFALTAVNLQNIKVVLNSTDFVMTHGSSAEEETEITLSSDDYAEALGINKVGDITFNVKWTSTGNVNQGLISVYNPDDNNKLLTTIKILGAKNIITKEDVSTGIYTGVADGYTSSFGSEYERHEVSLANAFAEDGTALFDYLIIYGETKTIDGTTEITVPTSSEGSNALTPYYIYSKAQSSETPGYDSYRFVQLVENANTPNKAEIAGFTTTAGGNLPTVYVDVEGSLSVYMTGFCPYATTGKDKAQEGVWFFRGGNGENLDIYLEDCYLYSRNKTVTGVPMNKGIKDHSVFTEGYALGSGGVLVFENIDRVGNQNMEDVLPFKVNVHTIGKNVFKSNYGSFYEIFGMRAYQISAPLHIHMNSDKHVHDSKTELTLDDVWPTGLGENDFKRTNGFLSLQKQSNNAPSIDLGSPLSVVNFKGGRVELQNAQIVSPNYKTTLAISYRSGEYGGDDVGIKFAYGIGTDSVGGTVNFYDGTTTVLPMEVDAKYRQYYLMDEDAEGNELTTTSCLRCPRNTYVYGGSQCFMRACNHVTSKGGAPTDGYSQLGQYVYSYDESQGDSKDDNGLLTTMRFPGCVAGLTGENGYYTQKGYSPQWQSVTPDAENKVYFWIPDGFGGVEAEEDKLLTTWKACMTEIHAGYQTQKGSIGGNTPIEPTEEVKYLLYCQIDDNIHKIISEGEKDAEGNVIKDEDGNVLEYVYEAPVKVPDVAQGLAGGKYMTISPTYVGNTKANEVVSAENYTITDKVYYITTATADVWMTFTAPFDVEKIWVVETYSEAELEKTAIKKDEKGNLLTKRESILLEQAKHNADFAAFFGVAMALGSTDDFETIFKQWRAWGLAEDKKVPEEGGEALYNGTDADYALRDKYKLTPYSKGDWEKANFYLNHNNNTDDWGYSYDEELGEVFVPNWEIPTKAENTDGVLLEQGETYSMLFPYCVGCWDMETIEGEERAKEREYWDYWSGKFLIFEGTSGSQTIQGSSFFTDNINGVFVGEDDLENSASLRGNSTFAFLETERENVYPYLDAPNKEGFVYETGDKSVLPTQSFLLTPKVDETETTQILSISRMGQIKYRPSSGDNNDDTQTGGEHVPTINGGSDLFVTSVAEGINIAVGEPQYVGVFSATGQLIYSGWVETSVDVNLVVDGVYVVVGENTSLKVLY